MSRSGDAAAAPLLCAAALALVACGDGSTDPTSVGCTSPYPPQASSPYILPYPAGTSFTVGQGNGGSGSHAPGTTVQYAYDFLMPIGTTVVASRGGRVLLVEERFEDATRQAGRENFVNVAHSDGTIAGYVHLTRDGALVEVGDFVERGDVIGLSGDSGSSSAPHLHFHVQSCDGCATEPVTFRNTRPHPAGLVEGQSYEAEPSS